MAWAASPASAKPGRTQCRARESCKGQPAGVPSVLMAPKGVVAGLGHGGGKGGRSQAQQLGRARVRHRPDQGHQVALGAVHGQQRQHLAVLEPLPRHALVWARAAQPRRHGGVGVGLHFVFDAKLGPGAAVLALADHGQFGWRGAAHEVDAALKRQRLRQPLLQRRHIHDPSQRLLRRGRVQVEGGRPLGVGLADPHLAHRRHGRGLGPDAQLAQQRDRGLVEGVGADVGAGRRERWLAQQRHPQALARQQQRQRVRHHTAAQNGDVVPWVHARIVGRGGGWGIKVWASRCGPH